MQIQIPDDLVAQQLAESIVDVVLEYVDQRLKLLIRVTDLPEYPNRSEVKKILHIGDDTLKDWIKNGLPIIMWTKKEDRFDRDDIKKHINSMKFTR